MTNKRLPSAPKLEVTFYHNMATDNGRQDPRVCVYLPPTGISSVCSPV